MLESLPESDQFIQDTKSEKEIAWIQEFVKGIRQIRGEMNINPGKRLHVVLAGANDTDIKRLEAYRDYLYNLARLEEITLASSPNEVPESATALLGKMTLLVPLKGFIDLDAEQDRLIKKKNQTENDLIKVEQKLKNPNFSANAPVEIVKKQQNRANQLKEKIAKLLEQLDRLQKITH